MLFVELRFFIFFAIVSAIYWTLRTNVSRKAVLLVASYVFYAAWDVRFLGLVLLSTVINYGAGLKMANDGPERSATTLSLAIVANLGILFFFKYFNFFTESVVGFATFAGLDVHSTTLRIVLPVGISFYTFQAISYVVDVKRGVIKAERNPLDFALFLAFFPHLVAGPIVRAADLLPQMKRLRGLGDVHVKWALLLFLIGFIKKACISDNIAPFVDQVFADPSAYTAEAVVSAVFLYAVQVYCDFSGYSDMAIAVARLLGYHFPPNFDAPYLAASITDFWRRWHMSLSTWLRDYLYIPLGGNRRGGLTRDRNLMIAMVLGGLWHGASYNFLIWGALHGAALIVNREWARRFAVLKDKVPFAPLLGMAATFYWVCLAWIFFRADTLAQAWSMAGTYLTWRSSGVQDIAFPAWPVLFGLGVIHALGHRYRAHERGEQAPLLPFAAAYGAVAALAIAFLPLGYRPFIYFQF